MDDDSEMAAVKMKPVTLIAMRHGGTHLIQPIIRQLTGKTVHVPKGSNALQYRPDGRPLIIFLRDPRNRLVSQLRYKRPRLRPEEADDRLASLISREKLGQTPMDWMLAWAHRWANGSQACGSFTLRFEAVIDDPLCAAECLALYLQVPGGQNAVEAIDYTLGKSGTFTGRHSRWREWFGPRATKAWQKGGGDRLLELMGYGDADEGL